MFVKVVEYTLKRECDISIIINIYYTSVRARKVSFPYLVLNAIELDILEIQYEIS